MVAAMRKANYNSMRGPFKFNNNHHPIQDFYLLQAVKADNGRRGDGDPEDGLREPQGRLLPRMQDEVVTGSEQRRAPGAHFCFPAEGVRAIFLKQLRRPSRFVLKNALTPFS